MTLIGRAVENVVWQVTTRLAGGVRPVSRSPSSQLQANSGSQDAGATGCF